MSSARLALAGLALLAGCRAEPAPADLASAPAPEPPAASVAAPAGPQPSDTMRALVTEVFGPVLEPAAGETTFPLVVVGILQGGEHQVLEFGAIEVAQPATPGESAPAEQLLFPIASLTKPVTALLLAKLASRGEIDLDAPAVECAQHPHLCPDGQAITWRRLATHTSGLPVLPDDVGELSGGSLSAYDDARLQAWLGRARLGRAPGSGFEYSTAGYGVLGSRLAAVQGRPFADLLRDEVLQPLGMRAARFSLSGDDLARLAAGHRQDGSPAPLPAEDGPVGALAPAGALVASVSDLLVFLETNVRPDAEWRAPVELLLRPHADIPSFPPSVMALGWQYLTPAGFYWHAGHGGGHHGFMAFHPQGQVGVVVLTNSATSFADTRLAVASFTLLGGLLSGAGTPAGGEPAGR